MIFLSTGLWTYLHNGRIFLAKERIPVYKLSPPALKNQPPILLNTLHWDGSQVDRFIPSRRMQNFESAKYNLMKKDSQYEVDASPDNYVDVLAQIGTLESTWRKRLMTRAIQGLGILSGVGDRRILNMSTRRDFKNLNYPQRGRFRNSPVDEWEEAVWKVKPRKWPLIEEHKQKVTIESMRANYKTVDWSSKECVVVPVGKTLHFFDLSDSDQSHISISVQSSYPGSKTVQCLKWNHAGTHIAIYSPSLTICMFNVEVAKVEWSEECLCDHCDITCMAWTFDDEQLVVGCSNGRVSAYCANVAKMGEDRLIECVSYPNDCILNLAISPNNRYLATTGTNRVIRIYLMELLTLHLEVGYYDAAQALAWHPWDSGILCIGGGQGDGSLSLWDMHRQQSIGYKRVAFVGHVKNMVWNNVSGELVVEWYYWIDNKRFVTIPVLASWDRIVDYVQWEKRYGNNVGNIIWNSNHTKLALHLSSALLIYNFFGGEESAWLSNTKDEQKSAFMKRHSSKLNTFCIR